MASFFDTNVLLYALQAEDGRKRDVARALIAQHLGDRSLVLSTQVLQEFFVNATRKLGLPAERVRAQVEAYAQGRVVQTTPGLILEAIDVHRLHGFSFWDSLVLSAARAARCVELLTEDLRAGRVLGGVKIVNPFA